MRAVLCRVLLGAALLLPGARPALAQEAPAARLLRVFAAGSLTRAVQRPAASLRRPAR